MTLLSKSLNTLGALLLIHAIYSAHEHSSRTTLPTNLTPSLTSPASSSSSSAADLPLDITLETLFSVVLICFGLVVGSAELRPISWRVWAGQIEREAISGENGREGEGVNPFRGLEERVGFLDIRVCPSSLLPLFFVVLETTGKWWGMV
ncbi:MAG: hypothetical protein M1827_006568 [Pycnora praestabilis]|nr:MAG: hypothetical protein M1827_006568 [Pycnora praestabilis]